MSLAEPDSDALALSDALVRHLRARMAAQGGALDFAQYMDLALYAPGLGYYAAGSVKFGAAGDFVTAPEISPLFGHALARQIAQVVHSTGGDVFEMGAGSGALACDVLSALEALHALPERYCILEVSPDLRARQQERLTRQVPVLASRVMWLDELPEKMTGCVIANEVLDALPVQIVHWRDNDIFQRQVAWDGEHLVWEERSVPAGALRDLAEQISVPPEYISEIGQVAQAWVRTLAERLERGALLLIDYGFGEREFYHPQRTEGTLMCHYRQRAHADPFFLPGLQDITAHIDFTAQAAVAIQAGLRLAGYTTQAHFLLNCGITELLARTSPEQAAAYIPQAAAVQKLLSPAEMGELFKVMALTRGIDDPLLGFLQGDQRRRL